MSVHAITSMSVSEIVAKIFDTVTSCAIIFMETAAQVPLGQMIFRFVDRFLWTIEKSAQWSLPAHEITAEENGKSFGKLELVRPLPWIFFLPVLIILRMVRVGLNVGFFILGYSKVEPAEMVKFLQKNRRRLRGIKSTGVKNMRQRFEKDNDFDMSETKRRSAQLLRTIQMTLSSLSCLDSSKMSPSPPPTRIKVHNHESTPTPEEQSTTESGMSPIHGDSKRKYSELSSEDHLSEDSEEETIQAKIDRLAAINDSVEDPDYSSPGMSTPEDDSVSISGGSNVSENEIEDLKKGVLLSSLPPDLKVKQAMKEAFESHTRASASESTGVEGNVVNSSIANASGNCEDFYSPCKLGEETEFYSPISSTSPSPDRMVSNYKQGQSDWPVENTIQTTDRCQNGEQEANMVSQIPGPNRKRTNGRSDEIRSNVRPNQTIDGSRISTNTTGKGSHAGKRGARGATHNSRKKK